MGDTGIARHKLMEHSEADCRVLEADVRYERRRARWHGRLIRALRPYGDRSTSVGDALRRAAADLGVEADGRGFEAQASLVAAAEARGLGAGCE